MTDLSNGIIEILGVQITPEVTLEKFEKENINKGSVFEEEVLSESVSLFTLNGWVCRLPSTNFDATKHQPFMLNGMTFLNVVLLFRNGRIERIELISDLQSYAIDEEGKKTYSPQKEEECYQKMTAWGESNFGAPAFEGFFCWNYDWGCIKNSTGSSSGSLYIHYGRNFSL